MPAWVQFDGSDYQLVQGRQRLSPHVELVPTPGHTPGHQSVVVDTAAGPQVIVAQAAYTSSELESWRGAPLVARQDAWCSESYAKSLAALHALRPVRSFFSHDASPWIGAA